MKARSLSITLASILLLTTVAAAQLPTLPAPVPDPLDRMVRGNGCDGGAPTKAFEVVALRLPIAYNNWGDHDPEGRLLVLLENVAPLLDQTEEMLLASGADAAAYQLDGLRRHLSLGPPPQASTDLVKHAQRGVQPLRPLELAAPLVIRVHVGDCVLLNLTNLLPEPASLHVHNAVTSPGQGLVLGVQEPDLTAPGATRTYRAYIPDDPAMEGAHFLHSHADARFQTKHGLFGAVVAEPKGSLWLAPDRDEILRSGLDARIVFNPALGTAKPFDFREHVLIYHDEVEVIDAHGRSPPIVSEYGEYGPGTKAINLRGEPFRNRFLLHDSLFAEGKLLRPFDKSQAYGSYTYGDPGVHIPRGYVGDPTKMRLLNAGPGQHHVHHLHGGGDRWRASPTGDDTQMDIGLTKNNKINQSKSERVDVQSIGPGESFTAEIEGGAGGVQRAAGDFLYHCHIVEHYVAGMWSFWRVYNTLQDDLRQLPDRALRDPKLRAVNSLELLNTPAATRYDLHAGNLSAWVEAQLPPRGLPTEDDASVYDWDVDPTDAGPLYRGEPESAWIWANYRSDRPGERPELAFDPLTGRLAYPFLTPQLGKRPPFAPDHGPAPYLDGRRAPDPVRGDQDNLCPADLPEDRQRDYNIVALSVPITYDRQGDSTFTDEDGAIFAHADAVPWLRANPREARNLVLRANQGDCIDVTLTSALNENDENHHHSKVNMHIHLVQFDPQASDGVITGFHYEQSVRPAASATTVAQVATSPDAVEAIGDGTWRVRVTSLDPFLDARGDAKVDSLVGFGLTTATFASARLTAIEDGRLVVRPTDPAAFASHDYRGAYAGYEFIHYRWFADVELGVVYWHDHVDGINGWRHGLFGSLIVEPAQSQWLHPRTGQPINNGTVADIVAPQRAYREYVVAFQDRSGCVPGNDICSEFTEGNIVLEPANRERELASLNLRAEPLFDRSAQHPLSDHANPADPVDTDLWEAYAGDDVVLRFLYAGQSTTTGVATFGVTGHRFAFEQNNPDSRRIDALSVGISTHGNYRLECGAGGCGRLAGDYLYGATQSDLLDRGAWGVFRVYGPADDAQGLRPLRPNQTAQPPLPIEPARIIRYNVTALERDVSFARGVLGLDPSHPAAALLPPFNDTRTVRLLLDDRDLDDPRPEPLVLRAAAGDLVEIHVTNTLDEPVGLHASLLRPVTVQDLGFPVGRNPLNATVPERGTGLYRYYADGDLGVAWLGSLAAPTRHPAEGLYGALVVEPTTQYEPDRGPAATLTIDGETVREHVLVYASDDTWFMGSIMPYAPDVDGGAHVNYRTANLHRRVAGQVDVPFSLGSRVGGMGFHPCHVLTTANCLNNPPLPPLAHTVTRGQGLPVVEVRNPVNPWAHASLLFGDPDTPVIEAAPGQRVVLRVVGGAGDQLVVHHVDGHAWRADPAWAGSPVIDAQTVGPREVANAWIVAGQSGDYLWGNHRAAFHEGGAWGILRVRGDTACPAVATVESPLMDLLSTVDVQSRARALWLERRAALCSLESTVDEALPALAEPRPPLAGVLP
jgi:manganese oxidase